MLVSAFITHKEAESFADCQDRFSINPDTKSIAVSDGLSQSIFQKYWAQILVDTYTATNDWLPDLEAVRELSPLWYEKVSCCLDGEVQMGRNPWRAKRSIDSGCSAGATILGVRFDNDEWICNVLGDSCFILVRDSHIVKLITSEDVEIFDNYPDYYDSNPQKTGKGTLKTERGKLLPGDTILLVSDPFSNYLLKNKGTEKEPDLLNRLIGIKSHDEFEAVVAEWRERGMHNDDSTLIIIKQDDSDGLNPVEGCIDNIDKLIADEKAKQDESADSKVAEEVVSEPTSDSVSDNIKASESTNTTIDISQLNDFDLDKYMQEIVESVLTRFMAKKDSWKKKIPDIWEEIKTAIVNYISKK
jgi:serine/threonine protein phosphatase PrpC